MNDFFQTLYDCVDKRLETTFKKLWKTKEYKELNKKHSDTFNNLYNNVDIEIQNQIELLLGTVNDLKETEKYRIYLTGFADGVQLKEYLSKINS